MKPETPLDYAVFQISPKHSRCELFVYSDGSTEKLASGLLKPFVSHLKVAEEQLASAAQCVKLEPGRHKNSDAWFTKGTLERFVRFVSTPEILESVNTFDAEMSQLEAARRIYSQGSGDQLSGGGGSGMTAADDAADDATKKELLRAIDVRLVTVQQDLCNATARAAAAGFNIDSVSELQMFADRFGAHCLNEACGKFISLCYRRPEFANPWRSRPEDRAVRSSYGSDMSIDDDPPSPPPRQDPVNPVSATFPLRRMFSREPSMERENGNNPNDSVQEKDKENENSTPEPAKSIQTSQPGRRLSVQDRINMFENKQKENSGGKPMVTKSVELRRLSSDVSSSGAAAAAAVEKAVLRRWSGASDMSIDLSAEKKDNESPLYTPSSEVVSQNKKVSDFTDDSSKISAGFKPEIKVIPSLARVGDSGVKEASSSRSDQFFETSKGSSNSGSGEVDVLKDQVRGKTQSKSFASRNDAPEDYKMVPGGNKSVSGSKDQTKWKGSRNNELRGAHNLMVDVKGQGSGKGEILNQTEESESTDGSVAKTKLKLGQKTGGDSGVFEGVAGSRIREAFAARYKGIERESSPAPSDISSVEENESFVKKEIHAPEKVSSSIVEDIVPQRMKFHRGPASEMSKTTRVQRDGSGSSGNDRVQFSGEVATDAGESFDSFSTPPPEQIERVRQAKGNQELNDELKMKANELEKLFAEHKLRVPGDQPNSARKGKSVDIRRGPVSSSQLMKPAADGSPQLSDSSKNRARLNVPLLTKPTDSKNSFDALNKNFSELSVSEDSRGKFYDRYMQKRNAKLREEWSSNRVEKEAKLKSLQDSLEMSRSEMKIKLSGSADQRDSASTARRRADRLRSYNSRSIMKTEQQHIKFGDSEDDDGALDDTSFVDDLSGGSQGKRTLPNHRNLSSSTPRRAAAPVPRSGSKTSTITSGKRRLQPENPLAQSVPNFSDLRKENTKPSSGGSKASRTQIRNFGRSKSTNEEAALVKDDKSRRSQSLRKSSANPIEFKDMSSLNSDGVALTPIKFDEEVLRSVGTKPFLKKGSRTGSAARASIGKQKGFMDSEPVNNISENDEFVAAAEEIGSVPEDGGEGEFETLNTESDKILDNEEPRLLLESDKFVNSESENGDSNMTFSRVDQVLGSHLNTENPSSFLPVESMQDWPGESPISWNSRTQHPFSYPHDMSDFDASVDSPVGSPASWNSHPLNQMENDAARMRKKWGTAQKPMLVSNSSNTSRKDMTRGFKRLLKFGRKNRGSETLVDWISATTSEGDDDTEDGRDPGNRSSEDLRKSRMGFAQAQPSDEGFNDSELFNESVPTSESSIPAPPSDFKLREDHMSGSSIKAPRSFFSLSTFRSKGSDSKAR